MVMRLLILTIIALLISPAIFAGDSMRGAKIAEMCFGCHGKNGNPIRYSFPQLAGQSEEYMLNRLFNFKDGNGNSNVMKKVTENLSIQQLSDLASYFSQQSSKKFLIKKNKRIIDGEKIYNHGRGFTPCAVCHGDNGTSLDDVNMPILSLQHPRYIARRLRHFKSSDLGVESTFADIIMSPIAKQLTDNEIRSVADYINSLSFID